MNVKLNWFLKNLKKILILKLQFLNKKYRFKKVNFKIFLINTFLIIFLYSNKQNIVHILIFLNIDLFYLDIKIKNI